MTPTPPPGMRIMSDDELTKPLPMDAVYWTVSDEMWDDSVRRGFLPDEGVTYATATPPPTDWRKLVEELTESLSNVLGSSWDGPLPDYARTPACATLTRAKAALEEAK